MNEVIDILMKRDDMTREDAIELIKDCKEELLRCDPFEADEVMLDMLGLEPDYLPDILYGNIDSFED